MHSASTILQGEKMMFVDNANKRNGTYFKITWMYIIKEFDIYQKHNEWRSAINKMDFMDYINIYYQKNMLLRV